ncbi:MAG TPA: ribosome small subunit-dependent GTPase A [Longimicrobiales bacterium]|nr:ribosome small subunit-dependent GTPase A [Longimicrobiales bacterium]
MSAEPAPNATVYATGGGVYQLRLDDGSMVEAALRGRVKLERRTGEKVVIGDRVAAVLSDEAWLVDAVAPRASEIVRRGIGGRRAKVVAANVDRVFAVVAARDPDLTFSLVDRLLVVAEASGIHPILVVNKIDLAGGAERAAEVEALYGPIGYRVLAVSAAGGTGMGDLRREISHGTSALMGPSGAGKSSILNALHPALDLRTGDLSRKTGRGRHTTVNSRLIPLECGGVVADTPGFGDVGLWGVASEDVAACFPEISALEDECRFRGCAHLKEPDCAVLEGIHQGTVSPTRYESYVRLREEAREAGAV